MQQANPVRELLKARRLEKDGDVDGALATLSEVGRWVTPQQARWAYTAFLALARRKLSQRQGLLYPAGEGRAAVLTPLPDGRLEVVAVLGLRWKPGERKSRASLRGVRKMP